MAPEMKDKKRKATESAAASKPPKKTKTKHDDASRPVDSKPRTTSKREKSAPISSKGAPPTKPSPAQAPATSKKAGPKDEVTSESVNAPTSKPKLPRKRSADYMSESEASDKEDGGVSRSGMTNWSTEKPDGSQKKLKKSKKKEKGNDFVRKEVRDNTPQVNTSKTTPGEAFSELKKAKKKTKSTKKQVGQMNKDAELDQSAEVPEETKAAEEPVTSIKSGLAKVGKNASKHLKNTISGAATKSIVSMSTLTTNGEDEYDGEFEEGDQTAALLKGFGTDDESSDGDESSKDEEYKQGRDLPPLDISAARKKRLEALRNKAPDRPGTIYIGHIPHGFYEHEMRAYFGQFGEIERLRLSRNKKTGQSKHYAFIEFASAGVAEIAAQAMDNYLLFGHILKVKIIPEAQIPKDLWKGANRRFNKVPWSKLEKEKLERGKTEQQWKAKNEVEQKKREEKLQKLTGIGYEFHMPALKNPKLPKAVKGTTLSSSSSSDSSFDSSSEDEKVKLPTLKNTKESKVIKSTALSSSSSSDSSSDPSSENKKAQLPVLKNKATAAAKETHLTTNEAPKTKKGAEGRDVNETTAPHAATVGKGGLDKSKSIDQEKDAGLGLEPKADGKSKQRRNKKGKQPASEAGTAGPEQDSAKPGPTKSEPALKIPNPPAEPKVDQPSMKTNTKKAKKPKEETGAKQTIGAAAEVGALANTEPPVTKAQASEKGKKVEQVINKLTESNKSDREGGGKAKKMKKAKQEGVS